MRDESRRYLARLNVAIDDTDRAVDTLSGGQRQAVAIARALRWNARLVIMDEPTAALGVAESRQVLDLIRELRARGTTVILVSHNMARSSRSRRASRCSRAAARSPIAHAGLTRDDLAHLVMTGNSRRRHAMNDFTSELKHGGRRRHRAAATRRCAPAPCMRAPSSCGT
jgi:ABC-type sugar transport system ATPase subunit